MFHLRFCLFVYVNLFFFANCSIPVEILCANSTCKEPISKAVGSVTYASSSRNVLSFKPGQEITITSKSKNKNDYWGAIIDGRSGYVPSNLIKEVRIFHELDDLVPVSVEALIKQMSTGKTSLPQSNNFSSENLATSGGNVADKPRPPPPETVPRVQENSIGPDSSSETYKVIEGTTVYVDGGQKITPSPTVDVTMNPKTGVPVVAGEGQERATIPPEVINLNANYQGQLLLKKNNLTIENEEEEEEEEEVEEDGEEDEEDDEMNEEYEGGLEEAESEGGISSDLPEKKEIKTEIPTGSVPPAAQPQMSADGSIGEGGSPTVVNVVESSVESKISSVIGSNDASKKENFQDKSVSETPPVVPEKEVVLKEEETPSNTLIEEKIVTDGTQFGEINADLNSSVEKQAEGSEVVPSHSQPVSSDPVTISPSIETKPPPQDHPKVPELAEGQPQPLLPEATTPPPDTSIPTQSYAEGYVPVTDPLQPIPEESATLPSQSGTSSQGRAENFATTDNQLDQNTTPQPTQDFYTVSAEIADSNSQPTESETTQMEEKIEPEPEPPSMNFNQATEVVEEREPKEIPPIVPETATSLPDVGERPEEVTEQPDTKSDEPGIFSQMAGVFSGLFSSNGEKPVNSVDFESAPDTVSEAPEIDYETSTGSCQSSDGMCEDSATKEQQSSFWTWMSPSSVAFDEFPTSNNTFLYLVVTAVTVLLFTLGHNFIEKKGKTAPLIAKINKLEQELLVTSKECFLLKDEVQSAKDKITLYENSANDELVLSLQAELEESKKTKAELESSIEVLQQELDAATEAGLDLNKMLSEVLTQKGGSESLLASVENLQAQLNSQQKVIDEMTKKLGVKNQENEVLQTALDSANEKAESLEEQLTEIKQNLNLHLKEKEDLTQDLNSQIAQLQVRINQLNESKEKEIGKMKKASGEVQKKLAETTKSLAVKEEECKALKESMKHLKSKGNVSLESVFDVSRLKAEAVHAEKEKQTLEVKLKEGESSKKILEDQAKSLNIEVEKLKKGFEEAEEKKNEAEKKLEVLSTYFKEKETQLQKELGLQEALWAQKKGDEKAVYNMMKSLQEEVDSYKSQNETLKKEILDQERGLKNQIAILEQKAHENWVAARQAERKLEENKQEAAQLRNRLTLIEKNSTNVEGKANHRTSEELNGEPPTSPVLHDTSSPLLFPPPLPLDPNTSSLLPPGFMPHPMFMPPPMGGFMPPPPFLPGDRRPPPLGRMSSPPLNSRFSPSSPADYPFERMSSPPLSPPARNYRSPNEADHVRHRTPPYPPLHPRNWDEANEIPGFIPISSQRDSIREHKGSNVSSGHSSSDSLDKSSRHSGRV